MKQTIVIALLMILSIGCKKENSKQDELQLVSGKWYLETEDGVKVSVCEKQSSTEFTADGRWLFRVYEEGSTDCEYMDGEGTYTVSGNNITVSLGTIISSNGTYSISNGTLTVQTYNEDLGRTETSTYDKTPG